MNTYRLRIGALAIIAAMAFAACTGESAALGPASPPAVTEPTEQEGISRITLTDRAAERLGIQIGQITEASLEGTERTAMPYGALIYDPDGSTWAYTNPEGLVYVREPLTVDHVDGDMVDLVDGPIIGTSVVSVGAAELYGIEYGIGE